MESSTVVVVMNITKNYEYMGTFADREQAEKYIRLLRKYYPNDSGVKGCNFRIMPQVVCTDAEKLFK